MYVALQLFLFFLSCGMSFAVGYFYCMHSYGLFDKPAEEEVEMVQEDYEPLPMTTFYGEEEVADIIKEVIANWEDYGR